MTVMSSFDIVEVEVPKNLQCGKCLAIGPDVSCTYLDQLLWAGPRVVECLKCGHREGLMAYVARKALDAPQVPS